MQSILLDENNRRLVIRFLSVLIAAIVLGTVSAFAQTGQLRGHVLFQQTDGSTTLAVDAVVDVYRTDKDDTYQTKTNKKGQFAMTMPFRATYIIAVSMPNARPAFVLDAKPWSRQ